VDLVGQEHAPDEALPAGADQDGAAIAKTQGEENVEARTKEADINAPAEAGVFQRNRQLTRPSPACCFTPSSGRCAFAHIHARRDPEHTAIASIAVPAGCVHRAFDGVPKLVRADMRSLVQPSLAA
jgi:hypothetical protein